MEKFRNKYRIPSTRLQTWDYGWNGSYFVTICTQRRICYFGRIESGVMHFSALGSMAEKLWFEIPVHFPFVQLSEFVIMPNHVHGIIIINKTIVGTQNFASLHCPPTPATPTQSPFTTTGLPKNRFGPQSQNLASVIRGYKTGVTKYANINNPGFQWQSRYYDHIIRDTRSFEMICNYIRNNPLQWEKDEFHE